MLRITTIEGRTASVTLTVEGPMTSDGAALLEGDCVMHLARGQRVILDLADVDFVDQAAIGTLRRLRERGVEIKKTSLTVEGLLMRGKDGV